VNPHFLQRQQLPRIPKDLDELWHERYESIDAFEKHLARNGTVILKFFLHVSREEQHRRFLDRVSDPDDHWKFRPSDWEESQKWDAYMAAYQAALRATSTPWAPWYCIPADSKPYMRQVVADVVVHTLERLPIEYPHVGGDDRAYMERIRKLLEAELRE
jgi:polyphosphate kinase 2 (PPK2 family)